MAIRKVQNNEKYVNKSQLVKILSNTSWLTFEKIFHMIISMFVGVWVARFLGPQQYGVFNYALSIVLILLPIAKLGLDHVVIKDLINGKKNENILIGTTFLIKIFSGFITYSISLLIISIINPNDKQLLLLVSIISLSTIFRAFEVIEFWFQSKVLAKSVVIIKSIGFLISSILKVFLILFEAELYWFGIAFTLEIFLATFGLILVYNKIGESIKRWKFDSHVAKKVLYESFPLILSGLFYVVYTKVDQIMIGNYLNTEAVGVYAAAVKLSEPWSFIAVAIVTSVTPYIYKSKNNSIQDYNNNFQKLFNILSGVALLIIIFVIPFSSKISVLLYGESYKETGVVLSIHIITLLFIYSGIVRSKWLINERLTKFTFIATFSGALINVVLNMYLIPLIGVKGAAIATLFSHFFSSYLINIFYNRTKMIFIMQTKSYLFFPFFKEIILFIKKRA